MKKNTFVIFIVILIPLTVVSLSSAQAIIPKRSANHSFTAEQITMKTPTGTLYGTLLLPQSRSSLPVALIIAGSGPTDRDGNSRLLKGPNNSLKLLAEGLAAHGIASVRYDKRGVGETGRTMQSTAEKAGLQLVEDDLTFESYIDDAVRWGKQLRADRRFSSLIVIGHSEGSLIGMVAARRIGANAFVSIGGAGRPVQQIILEQVKSKLTPELLKAAEDILNQLVAGKKAEPIPAELNALFRPSVQPYLISWLRYDPAKEISKLRMPILIAQGTTDVQASLQDAQALVAGNSKATLLLIEGMNHVFKTVPKERDKQASSYSDPTLPVAPELIKGISKFVNITRGR